MSSTVSVRVPNEVKKKLEELDINISEAVRGHLLEIIAREERLRKLEEVDRVLRSRNLRVPEGTALSLIREERDLER
ncbi:MAG TPA: type II toxin-antitoxin system CcdA family antitoxin [Candidatus Bathyarchaeia archaeon]